MGLGSFFKKNGDSLLAAIAGFSIIFLFTRHGGIGIEPDSVVYLSVADNLHAKGSLVDFAGDPLADFPAFYPFFLSAILFLTGLKPLVFAPLLNALLFAFIIYLSGYIMERFSYQSKWYKWAVLSCIVISPCLLEVYSMLMSETIFLVLEMLFFIAIRRYLKSYSRNALIIAAVFASLATVTRYAGITIVATGAIVLLADMKLPMRKKMTDLFIFSSISVGLLIINLIWNFSLSKTMTGDREKSITSLHENMHDAGSVFYDWLPFLHGHYTGAGILFMLIIAGLGFLCIKRFIADRRLSTFEDIAAIFSLIYLLFIILIASVSRFEALNSRFLVPVFIPLLWSSSHWIVASFHRSHSKMKWLLIPVIVIFFLFQYGQLAWDYETWDGVKDAGIPGYTEDQWRYSETVQFIQKDSLLFQKGFTVYSDASDAIYFFTGRVGKFLPSKKYQPGIKELLNDHHCYVVWFDDGYNPDFVDKTFLTGTKKMTLLKQFSDGAIYKYDE